MPNNRLGKGLNSIFGTDISAMLDDIQNGKSEDPQALPPRELPVSMIRPNPYQPRKVFDKQALEDLSSSIKEHGVFTPVLVRKSLHGYDLIAGERRLRATKMAGLEYIPAIVMDYTEEEMMEIALLENIQRENLNVIEEARAYEQMMKTFGYTQEQTAERIGKSREHIANLLRLLKLPDSVQDMVIEKKLSMGHVRALLGLKDPQAIVDLAKKAAAGSWSVRKVEQAVKEAGMKPAPAPVADPMDTPFIREAKRQLEDYFQTSVTMKPNSITLYVENPSDITRILEKLSLIEEE